MQTRIDGNALHLLFEGGYRNLKKNMTAINDLNVFPVPDGDTGTNMVRTLGGGLHSLTPINRVGEYMKALSRAVLLSARGNSGVIFSQFVHGLYRGFENSDTVTFSDFAVAFECARDDAYRSIITPTEGTILTLIREAADFLKKDAGNYAGFEDGLAALVRQLKQSLAKTPELLDVLREAGVVDSGGAGLVCFFEGMLAAATGEDVEDTPELSDPAFEAPACTVPSGIFGPDSVLKYGYCTEFILQLMHAKTDIAAFDRDAFVKPLEQMGDSIVCVANDGIVKVHIHTFTPEKVLEYGRRFGEFINIKIENMSVQHSETQAAAPEREKVKYAVIAVASGQGIIDYFYSIGATAVIDGGQTDNPSVDAFIDAINSVNAEHTVLLPDNSNIILTAQQAAAMCGDRDIRVIPTRSVAEGYSALSMMNLWCDTADRLVADMSMCLDSIVTGLVTTAVRDTVLQGRNIKKGDHIGLADKTLLSCTDNRVTAARELIDAVMQSEEREVIVVFYGKTVTADEVSILRTELENSYPLADIGFIDGGQDIYDFIISLE